MFCKEVYVNYCQATATCALQLDSTTTVLNTLFTEAVYPFDQIMARINENDPSHYSLMVEYYLSGNRPVRIRSIFWTYVAEVNGRLDEAFGVVSVRPVV